MKECVNTIIISDHGMARLGTRKFVNLSKVVLLSAEHYVIVKSRCEYNIAVISQVRGAAEDAEISVILYEHARDLTGFYPVH